MIPALRATPIRLSTLLGVTLLVVMPGVGRAEPEGKPRLPSHRIIHRFDFDEWMTGNLENEPKFWTAIRLDGFPRFAGGGFDLETGRSAPPSLHLDSQGRSVAYYYEGPDTRVRPHTDYRLEGFVRADRLQVARACLSAHYLDEHGRPIPGTVVRSAYIGGPDEPDAWARVDLHLPSAPREARTIGLIAWVLAEPQWNTATPARRHIPRTDVHGGAWFDDITIFALPHVEITTDTPGGVFTPDDPQDLVIILADHQDASLVGRLTIRTPDGRLVKDQTIAVAIDVPGDPQRVPLDGLDPGWYEARLDVFDGETPVVSRTLAFIRTAPQCHGPARAARRPFGVVIDPRFRSDSGTELALLQRQLVRSAKLPVWTGLADDPPTPVEQRDMDRLLRELLKNGFSLTGVFNGPPGSVVKGDGPYPRSLYALLAEQPETWQEHLATVVAPYAGVFRWWQVGPDAGGGVREGNQLSLALKHLRGSMKRFITSPQVSIPVSPTVVPDGEKPPVEQITLTFGSQTDPDWFATEIQRARKRGFDFISAYVESLPEEHYRRLPRLADFAQRIILARHAGAQTVFVPQAWQVRNTPHGRVTEPTEEYLIVRTLADVLGGAIPGKPLDLPSGVRCLPFHDGNATVLALWDEHAPPTGRDHAIQLGQADRQIDLWGRSTPFERDEHGRQIVHLTNLPVLVMGVERWLADFRTAFTLTPSHVETGNELVEHTLDAGYKGSKAVSGQIRLSGPESWEITPHTFRFSLMPDRAVSFRLKVHYPHNEPAGRRNIIAEVSILESSYYLEIPLAVELGLSDVDVWGMAVLEGNALVLTHTVANRSDQTLHFRGAAIVPGQERQYRPILNLEPGETQTVVYRFTSAAGIAGAHVRLALREMNDGPRLHSLELTVP